MPADSKVSDLDEHGSRVIIFQLVGSLVGREGVLLCQLDGTRRGALQSKLPPLKSLYHL